MFLSSAGIVIISEIPSGKEKVELFLQNWNLTKLCILTCNQNLISYEIECLHKICDIVIVIDRSSNSNIFTILSKLFNEKLCFNSTYFDLSSKCNEIVSKNDANLPSPAKILTSECDLKKGNFPVIYFQNIFVIKDTRSDEISIPTILQKYLNDFKKSRSFKKQINVILNGNSINEFEINVSGVVTSISKSHESLKVVASSDSFENLIEFQNIFKEKFGSQITSYSNCDIADLFNSVFYEVDVHLRNSIKVIEKCFEEYGPENIFVGFNGGKDCTVLLHLTMSVLKKHYPEYNRPLVCWYVRSTNAFVEQDVFIKQCKDYYNLDVITDTSDIKNALAAITSSRPNMKACFMGTRRTDPYSENLKDFQATDPGWPQIMRVMPLLNWHYSYIWDFLLYFQIPYCSLYDVGYTSLGNITNTVQNPSLLTYNVLHGKMGYLPAYKLMDASEERYGRQ